jgi:hypothetical protein
VLPKELGFEVNITTIRDVLLPKPISVKPRVPDTGSLFIEQIGVNI